MRARHPHCRYEDGSYCDNIYDLGCPDPDNEYDDVPVYAEAEAAEEGQGSDSPIDLTAGDDDDDGEGGEDGGPLLGGQPNQKKHRAS